MVFKEIFTGENLPRLIVALCYVVLAPFIGALLEGIDRKLSARMQGRKGPSILQPFYDFFKLCHKQSMYVNRMQMMMIFAYLFFIVLTGGMFFAGLDVLMCFFALSTAAMFLILAATSTHSPYATLGTQRELLQMMAYEPMVLLTAVGFYQAVGSFRVIDIANTASPLIAITPGFFIGFVFILTIKFRKSPFDLSASHHAHQEVVRGITTEMIGRQYATVMLAEWYENIFLLGVVGLFFVTANPFSLIWTVAAILVVYFVEIVIDNTSARVNWKLMLKLAWGATIIFGGLNFLVLQLLNK